MTISDLEINSSSNMESVPKEQVMTTAQQLQNQLTGIKFGNQISRSTTQITELPSNFLPYPSNTKIYYRPYTYREIDDFNDSDVDLITRLRFILEGIQCHGIDKHDITLGDFLYLALYRRISSLGTTTFAVQFKREETTINKSFTFEDIAFEQLEVPALPIIATISGVEMHFKPLTVGMFLSILERDILPGHKDYERACLAAQVINIDYETAYDIISNAIGQDLVVLNQIDKLLFHSTKPLVISYKHKGQLYTDSIPLDNPFTLVYPFCRPQDTKGDPIRFGL